MATTAVYTSHPFTQFASSPHRSSPNPDLASILIASDSVELSNHKPNSILLDEGGPPYKKLKRFHGDVGMALRQTAEIVMVLTGMSALRAGAAPTPVEYQLANEAYEKLAALVAHVAPHELVSKDSLRNLIRQLTVPQVPVRPPAKPITIQPTPTPTTQTPEPAAGPATAPEPAPVSGPAPVPAPAPTPTTNPTTSVKTTPSVTEIGKSKHGVKESPPNVPATRTTDTQTIVVIKGSGGGQAPKVQARQRGAKNVLMQPITEQQQTHQQLILAVQQLLKPSIPTVPLARVASVYMSPPVLCGYCKLVAHDTNSVIVCDGCESGFHLLCIQMTNSKAIPKSDWYCPKCVMASGCRPQPPKYGPLRRGHAAHSGTRNSWSMQGQRGNESAKGQTSGKPLLQLRKRDTDVDTTRDAKEAALVKMGPPVLEKTKNLEAAQSVSNSEDRQSDENLSDCNLIAPTTALNPVGAINTRASGSTNTGESKDTGEPQAEESAVTDSKEDTETATSGKSGGGDDGIVNVEWVGPVVNVTQGNVYYAACSVAGVTMRLQDTAFFRPETTDTPPYIARLQALWEETKSGLKWVKVNWCYYPTDLPLEMGRPATNDSNEVYESNHSDNNLVGSIQGPCQVLPPLQYEQEVERRKQVNNTKEELIPIFLCRWFYDAPRGVFRASSDGCAK